MEKFYAYQDIARAIVEQIKKLSTMLENDPDMREYVNILMNSFFTEDDEPVMITNEFLQHLLFTSLVEERNKKEEGLNTFLFFHLTERERVSRDLKFKVLLEIFQASLKQNGHRAN